MNVTTLRQELEKLERIGWGEWEVDVAPVAALDDQATGKPRLDFDFRDYEVCDVDSEGDPEAGFVFLRFDATAESV